MSASENKTLLRRYLREVWENQNPAAARGFLALDYQRHTSPDTAPLTLDDQVQRLIGFRAAFPDIQIVVEEVIADGDHMAFRSTMRGTHQGELMGISPTGEQVTIGLIDVMCVGNGRIFEQWGGPDLFDLLRQLGAVFSISTEGN
jgi:predicted ester cyclase